MMGILKSNRDNILQAIKSFYNSLSEIESTLQEEDYSELESILNGSHNSYLSLIGN